MSHRCLVVFFVQIVMLVLSSATLAQVEVEPDQRYLLLATARTSTMQEELDQAPAPCSNTICRTSRWKAGRSRLGMSTTHPDGPAPRIAIPGSRSCMCWKVPW